MFVIMAHSTVLKNVVHQSRRRKKVPFRVSEEFETKTRQFATQKRAICPLPADTHCVGSGRQKVHRDLRQRVRKFRGCLVEVHSARESAPSAERQALCHAASVDLCQARGRYRAECGIAGKRHLLLALLETIPRAQIRPARSNRMQRQSITFAESVDRKSWGLAACSGPHRSRVRKRIHAENKKRKRAKRKRAGDANVYEPGHRNVSGTQH
jgi:hypothetical protein